MAFIVRIALLCFLLAAIPCITIADDSGDHDSGHENGGSSAPEQVTGDSPDGSNGSGESADSRSEPSTAGTATEGSDTAGSDRDSGTGTSFTESVAGDGDSPDDKTGTAAPEGAAGSGTEEIGAGGSGTGRTAPSGTGSDSDTSARDRNASETKDTGKGTGETDNTCHESDEGTGSTDRSHSREPSPQGEDYGSAGSEELDEDSPSEDEDDGQDASRHDSLQYNEEEEADRDSGTKHDAVEKRDRKDGTETLAGEREDAEESPGGFADTGTVFGGTSRTLHNDPAIFSGNSGDEGRPFWDDPGYRDPVPEGWGPASPQPDPRSRLPSAGLPALPASGLPLGVAAGITDSARPHVRSKGKDEHEQLWNPMDTSMALSPWMLLKLWCFLGFRRVLRKNVLESNERRSLYDSITQYPGVDLSRLTEMLRLNKETARYHLKMLAQNGKISGLIKQGIARYFPCRETISEFEKTVIHYLWIATTKRILLLLIESPGVTRQAIARELGIAGPSVTWQMQRLADDGLIEVRTEGRFVKYFLTPDSTEILGTVTIPDHRGGPSAA